MAGRRTSGPARPRPTAAGLLIALLTAAAASPASGQDELPRLFISEVIADNGDVGPEDLGGGSPDMIEIYNGTDILLPLGTQSDRTSYYLSDTSTFDATMAWRFPPGLSNIPARGRIVIFCDGLARSHPEAQCELHASFQIDSDGNEPITLWGPEVDGERPIIDQVWLPPLRRDVSLGRLEDAEGPLGDPRLEIDQVLDFFTFHPLGSESPPTFGICRDVGSCVADESFKRRFCSGAPNGPGANLEPRIDRDAFSTNRPKAGEPVRLTARVRDDKPPVTPNIASAEVVFRTRRGLEPPTEWEALELALDGGVHDGAAEGRPLEFWSLWKGTIPGQPAGVRVEFFFRVRDAEGLETTSPPVLCAEAVGPCDRSFGGPGCVLDTEDVSCNNSVPVTGERFVECRVPFTYASGYVPRDNLGAVVINEVAPLQEGLLEDVSETEPCTVDDGCTQADPFCCRKKEDFIELFNGSDAPADLSGLWLSDLQFEPRVWQFPSGSEIGPGEHVIVWLDDDGGKCLDANRSDPPCFWECPDPTIPGLKQYHTNFALDFEGDQIYLRDDEAHGFGFIHGLDFDFDGVSEDALNRSYALQPSGDPEGCFVFTESVTPRAANPDLGEPCPSPLRFVRGDSNGDGTANVSDPSYLLNALFLSGPALPCRAAGDSNGDGAANVSDASYLLNYLFLAGPAPEPPFPSCGPPSLDGDATLGCETVAASCR